LKEFVSLRRRSSGSFAKYDGASSLPLHQPKGRGFSALITVVFTSAAFADESGNIMRLKLKRRSIYIGEFLHQSPIPHASRIGNVVVSGLIRGVDPSTQKFPSTLEQQCVFMFENVRRTVEAGGGHIDDIIKLTFWMSSLSRKAINDEWVKMFPDAGSRPARQIMEVAMEPHVLVQCDFMAVVADPDIQK
jgi:2-iminobutanoate/2-iminopropanoate deaminase